MRVPIIAILIAGMLILVAAVPVCAYDYRGVPRPGENNPENLADDLISEEGALSLDGEDLSSLLTGPGLESLIMFFLMLILQFLGIPLS